MIMNKEREADLWGMCLLIRLGATKELNDFIKAHPEQTKWYFLVAFGCIVQNLPNLPFLWLKVLFGVHIAH